jgi:hypothetical protein
VSQDPIRLLGGMPNMYSYVEDLNVLYDPLGLFTPVVLTEGTVYRMGSATPNNMTPRQEFDPATGLRRKKNDLDSGLSTTIKKPKGKSQAIDVAKLKGTGLEAVQDGVDHVTIRPVDDPDKLKLKEWAETKGTPVDHEYSKAVANACG